MSPLRLVAAMVLPVCLGACATPASDVHAVSPPALAQLLQPGVTTRDQAQAALAPEQKVVFDSGYEVWLYHYAAPAGAAGPTGEWVVLFGPDGVLRKTRQRPPDPPAR